MQLGSPNVIQKMFYHESWKPTYFGVKRSKVKVTRHKNSSGVDFGIPVGAGFFYTVSQLKRSENSNLYKYNVTQQKHIITARRYDSAVYAVVCLSVRPSVTHRCCTKTAKQRIKQTRTQRHTIAHQDSSFLTPKISAIFRRGHP